MKINYITLSLFPILLIFTSGLIFKTHLTNPLPIVFLLDISLLLLTLLFFNRFDLNILFIFSLLFLYILYTFLLSTINGAHILDYLLSYKSFFYLILLTLVCKRKILSFENFRYLYFIVSITFSTKYIISFVFEYGYQNRPSLIFENNMELMFLLILHSFYCSLKKVNIIFHFLIFLCVFLSGSLSITGAYLMIVFFNLIRGNKISILFLTKISAILLFSFLIILITIQRRDILSSMESIDRVYFLKLFINETKFWPIHSWFFGTSPLSPVSNETANALSFYKELFSYGNINKCYSVIFHSMFLRTLYDHGILGLLSIYFCIYYILKSSGLRNDTIFLLLLCLLFNSFSVSSYNSIFTILSLFIIIITKNRFIYEVRFQYIK